MDWVYNWGWPIMLILLLVVTVISGLWLLIGMVIAKIRDVRDRPARQEAACQAHYDVGYDTGYKEGYEDATREFKQKAYAKKIDVED